LFPSDNLFVKITQDKNRTERNLWEKFPKPLIKTELNFLEHNWALISLRDLAYFFFCQTEMIPNENFGVQEIESTTANLNSKLAVRSCKNFKSYHKFEIGNLNLLS